MWGQVRILRVDPHPTSVYQGPLPALRSYESGCDLQVSSTSVTWELVRNADSQAHPGPSTQNLHC